MLSRSFSPSLAGLTVLAVVAIAVSGCSSPPAPVDDPPAQAADGGGTSAPDDAAAGATDAATDSASASYPTCDEVKAVLGPEAASLAALPDAENGEKTGSSGRELSCTWATPQTQAQSLDLKNYGGISLGIMRDPSYVESDYAQLGWNIDDPRLRPEGAWALTAGGKYDPSAQVNVTSVQVVREGTVVVITGGGAMTQDVPELAALTQSWAVGAGLAVLDLMR